MRVVFNADDFGRSAGINAAVLRAHRDGVLTSASLMVTGEAASEAISQARETPSLAVGLHLVVAGGRPALPPAEIPHIVGRDGSLPGGPLGVGLRYYCSRLARKELAREMSAQFALFAATGLPLAHVDCHMHMHLHPVVFRLLLPLAEQYGAGGLRLPRDDFWLAIGYSRRHLATKIAWALAFGLLCSFYARRLRRHQLAVAERVYGLMQTGRMEEGYVLRVLRRLRVDVAELYFHPSLTFEGEAMGPNPGDLTTLLSPAVREAVSVCGLEPATYAGLPPRRAPVSARYGRSGSAARG